jgi:uncharacterized protein YdhG (YjbR/CyaY superfamily)
LSELRALIHRVAPKTVEAMQYGLPAFGDLCALASQKNYMALYVCESDLVKAHLAQLGKVSCGKGCIRFKRLTDLNLSTVESLLREIAKLRKAGIGPSCRTCVPRRLTMRCSEPGPRAVVAIHASRGPGR